MSVCVPIDDRGNVSMCMYLGLYVCSCLQTCLNMYVFQCVCVCVPQKESWQHPGPKQTAAAVPPDL